MKLSELKLNERNPRQIKGAAFEKLKKSVKELPKMMRLRPIVIDADGVILGGNMRYRALQALGYSEIPNEWVKVADDLTEEEKQRFIIEDNVQFGEWDFDMLFNEWDTPSLEDWGVEIPDFDNDFKGGFADDSNDDADTGTYEKSEAVEQMLDVVMRQYAGEFLTQVDKMMEINQLCTGWTKSYATIKFIKAKYYGKHYPRHCSLVFTPRQFFTAGNKRSYYDVLKRAFETGSQVQGLKTCIESKDDLKFLFSCSYPMGGGRMCLDFPVEKARILIRKYAGKGGRVLDPCHGWGGRLTAAMMEDVAEYVGFDPSPYAHKGVAEIFTTFEPYCETKNVRLLEQPFEDGELEDGHFDFALTSPPYFDVEKYEGAETSTARYSKYELWRDGFYTQLIRKTYSALRQGGVFCLQVGSQKYPLKDDGIRIAQEAGFNAEVIGTKFLTQGGLHDTEEDKSEVLLLLQKN